MISVGQSSKNVIYFLWILHSANQIAREELEQADGKLHDIPQNPLRMSFAPNYSQTVNVWVLLLMALFRTRLLF
jgi:hypothetical protein